MSDTTITTEPRRRILPPHSIRPDFLPPQLVSDLLACAEENESRFKPARVGRGAGMRLNPAFRVSSKLNDFGPLKSELENRLRPLAPELAAQLQVQPFEISRLELELVAHNDGAFYKPHIDLQRPAEGETLANMRVLSGVYYLHAMPKAFEGGALRLLEIGNPSKDRGFVDIEPVHNSLVFFPSWMPHEVRPVSCPSGRFMDSRFAINCWFHRAA